MSWLTDYLQFTAKQESPGIFHFWNAITTVAGAVGRKVWLPRVSDGIERYRIYPGQIMVVLVAGSGRLRKSTSIKLPSALFDRVKIKNFNGGTSPEKFLAMLGGTGPHNRQGNLVVLAPELSTFLSRQQYATHLVNILNDLADAPDHKDFPTIGRGDVWVQNACITLLGATTPVDLAESIPPSALQRGFSSRIIFVYADKTDRKESLSETKVDPVKKSIADQARDRLIYGVQQFANLSGPMDFTDAGRLWYDKWYSDYADTDSEESEGWGARRHDHMLRVAMTLQICKDQSTDLDVDCLQRADEALKMVEEHLPEVFAKVGLHQTSTMAIDRILAVFKKGGGKTDNFTLYEKCIRYFPDPNAFNKVLYSLQANKWITKTGFDPVTGRQDFLLTRPDLGSRNGGPPDQSTP